MCSHYPCVVSSLLEKELTNRLECCSDHPKVNSRISRRGIIWVKQYVLHLSSSLLRMFYPYSTLIAPPRLQPDLMLTSVLDLGHGFQRRIHHFYRHHPTPKRPDSSRCTPRSGSSTLEISIKIKGLGKECKLSKSQIQHPARESTRSIPNDYHPSEPNYPSTAHP